MVPLSGCALRWIPTLCPVCLLNCTSNSSWARGSLSCAPVAATGVRRLVIASVVPAAGASPYAVTNEHQARLAGEQAGSCVLGVRHLEEMAPGGTRGPGDGAGGQPRGPFAYVCAHVCVCACAHVCTRALTEMRKPGTSYWVRSYWGA